MTLTYDAMPPTRFLQWMRLPNGNPPRLDWSATTRTPAAGPNILKRPYAPGLRDISDIDTYIGEIRTHLAPPIGRRPKLWLSESQRRV